MPHLDNCRGILRRLIAKGDPTTVPLAERAINEYLEWTPPGARKSGLRLLQDDVMAQQEAVVGVQRTFAESVNDLLEKKITES
jgi:hypothetical protein